MGTSASITVKHSDGSLLRSTIYWDEYPSHVLKIFKDHYASTELAEKFVSMGDISSLAASMENPERKILAGDAMRFYVEQIRIIRKLIRG